MPRLPVKYCGSDNFGDALNPFIFERVLGVPTQLVSVRRARVLGLGSVIETAMRPKRKAWSYAFDRLRPPLAVWTSGFIREEIPADFTFVRKLDVLALRGKKSLALMNRFQPVAACALGDGALLSEALLPKRPAKRWRVGLIPHVVHGSDPRFQALAAKDPRITVLDLRRPPLEVLEEVAACDAIFSSSLHGLILSDVFGVPNAPLDAGTGLIGGWFKFHDYYSVFSAPSGMERLITLDRLCENFETEISALSSYTPVTGEIATLRDSLMAAFQKGVHL